MSWLRRVVTGALVASAIGLAAWFGVARWRGPRVPVVYATPSPLAQTLVASGRALSPAEVSLGSMLGGVIRAVHAREGERVTQGQTLVEFDDAELLAQVAQARAALQVAGTRVGQVRVLSAGVANASVRQAEANVTAARLSHERAQALVRSGALAATELEAARRALDVAESQLRSARITAAASAPGGSEARGAVASRTQAEAALRVAEARLAQATVTASASGTILRRSVEPGDVVSPGRALLVLLRDGPMELSITPDERNLSDLRLGQRAVASAEAFPTRTFPAAVSYIAPAVDALRGTIEVRLQVPSPPDFLRPSMTVSVEIEVARKPSALSLAADAVRDAATSAPWVMVVTPEGRLARRAVRLGLRGDRAYEVAEGLRAGEAVVPVSAGASLAVGQRVRVDGAAGP
ncbi:MAG: efflux RND transporter periplasmic adaptor subunit [Polyangiales bacterium]